MGQTAKQLAGLRLLVKQTLARAGEGPAWLERTRRAVATEWTNEWNFQSHVQQTSTSGSQVTQGH